MMIKHNFRDRRAAGFQRSSCHDHFAKDARSLARRWPKGLDQIANLTLSRDQMVVVISVARVGRRWAVQHCGGYLGHTSSCEEATAIATGLVSWLRSQGREAELVVGETRSFAPSSVLSRDTP
jgi:hypothetical protein